MFLHLGLLHVRFLPLLAFLQVFGSSSAIFTLLPVRLHAYWTASQRDGGIFSNSFIFSFPFFFFFSTVGRRCQGWRGSCFSVCSPSSTSSSGSGTRFWSGAPWGRARARSRSAAAASGSGCSGTPSPAPESGNACTPCVPASHLDLSYLNIWNQQNGVLGVVTEHTKCGFNFWRLRAISQSPKSAR